MRHIITGGSGFLGRYLAQELSARHEETLIFDLVAPSVSLPLKVKHVQGDVRDASELARLRFGPNDVVYHLAARQFHVGVPRTDRDEWFASVNTAGTSLLLESMARSDAGRLVYFSTDMVYGKPQRTPVSPEHPLQPIGPYGRSKVAAEGIIARHVQGGMKITVFRPRLIIGAGRYGVLQKLFHLIEMGLPVPMIGTGRNRYQMVSVHDCVDAALRAVDLELPTGPFNLGSTAPPTVRDLLKSIIQRAQSRSHLLPTPAGLTKAICAALDLMGLTLLYPEQYQIADVDFVVDTTRTGEVLSWKPKYSDYDMMIAAYDDHLRMQRTR